MLSFFKRKCREFVSVPHVNKLDDKIEVCGWVGGGICVVTQTCSSAYFRLPSVLVGFHLIVIPTPKQVMLDLALSLDLMANGSGLAAQRLFDWLIYLMKPKVAVKQN